MPEFDLPGAALDAATSPTTARATEMICLSPITVKLIFAALAILVFLACHAVHGDQGPRR